MGLFGSPEKDFWTWFGRNSETIRSSLAAAKSHEDFERGVFAELHQRLSHYHPGLVWEFGQDRNAETTEFVVSADGNRANFAAVARLTAAAPTLPRWKITAFRPRKDVTGLELQFAPASAPTERVTLSAKNIRFHLAPQGSEMVAIRLFVEGMRERDENVKGAMFLFLDAALGEHDMETKVGAVDVQPASAAPPGAPLAPFSDLSTAFDAFFARR